MAGIRNAHLWPGVPFAIGAAVLFGASTPLSKYLLGSIDSWLLAGVLYFGAGVGLTITYMVRAVISETDGEASLRRKDLPWLTAVVFFGGVVGPVLLMFGLSMTTASSASLLLNVEGIATMAIAWIVFRENVDSRLIVGALAIVAGAAALSWSGEGVQLDWGSLFIMGACLAWGIDNNLTRKLSSADPVQIAAIKGMVAGSMNIMLAFALGARLASLPVITGGLIVGFFGIGVSLVLFMLGLRHLGTARTGAYFSMAPFIGAALAILILGDPITPQLLVAGVLMAIGLWLHLAEQHDHDHVHEELVHDHRHKHDEHHDHVHEGQITEPHSHLHRHTPLRHKHPHYPDLHHRHRHG